MCRIRLTTNGKTEALHASRHPVHKDVYRLENIPFLNAEFHYQDWIMCTPDALPAACWTWEDGPYRTLSIEWIVMDSAAWAVHPIHAAIESLQWPAEGCLTGLVVAMPKTATHDQLRTLQLVHKDLLFRLDGILQPTPTMTELDLEDIPAEALPVMPLTVIDVTLNAAMFELVRACAQDYLQLPRKVLKAYTDRDHSKFDVLLWQAYLNRLVAAIEASYSVPRHVKAAYQRVLAAQGQAVRL